MAHLAILGAVALAVGLAPSPPPRETIQWVDLAPNLGQPQPANPAPSSGATEIPGESSATVTPEPPAPTPSPPPTVAPPEASEPPAPVPPPEKEALPTPPVKPQPKPVRPPPRETAPKPALKTPKTSRPPPPAPSAPAKPKIKVSTKVVTRVVGGSTSATKGAKPLSSGAASTGAAFDPAAFSKGLLNKLKGSGGLVTAPGATGKGTAAGSGPSHDFAWYYNLIFQAMYGAWAPPFGLEEGLHTQVLIRVEKNGVISKVSLASSSGNKSMDDSALAAANRVKKLPPLPDGLGDSFAEITVHFKVQKP